MVQVPLSTLKNELVKHHNISANVEDSIAAWVKDDMQHQKTAMMQDC